MPFIGFMTKKYEVKISSTTSYCLLYKILEDKTQVNYNLKCPV